MTNRNLALDGAVTGTFDLQRQSPWRFTDSLDECPVAPNERDVTVGWLAGSISERPAVRREVVALYDEACARLGVEPRPHA